MSNDPGDPEHRYLLRIVACLLVAIVAGEVIILGGRAIGCVIKNGIGNCPFEEVQYGVEQLAALLATIIALIFALLKK